MKICSSGRLHLIKVCLETSGNHSYHEKRKSTLQEFDLQTSGLLSTVQGFDLKIAGLGKVLKKMKFSVRGILC